MTGHFVKFAMQSDGVLRYNQYHRSVECVILHHAGSFALCCCDDGTLAVVSVRTDTIVGYVNFQLASSPESVCFNEVSDKAFIGCMDGYAYSFE